MRLLTLTKPMEKPMIRNVLKTLGSIRAAFVVATGIPFLIATSAFAQNPPPPPPTGAAPAPGTQAEVERVIVTGSNIPTAEEVGANPVLNLNRDLINKSGERNTEQLLKDLPIASAGGVPVTNNGAAQGGPTGTSSVSLRGFDVSATLVLIDGRRVAPFPANPAGGGAFVDLNSIPLPAVQSIEVLKDGASATYGADAIAGVINIKLYKDYRGAQLTLEYGNTLDKDAGLYNGDILFGVGDDKMSITGDIWFYHHNSMFNRDRGNSDKPPFLSSNNTPWNFQLSQEVIIAAGGTPFPTTNPKEFGTPPNGTLGTTPPSDWIFFRRRVRASGGLLPGFNFNAFSSSFPEQERWGGCAAFNEKICDDQLQIYGDFYYNDVKSHDELAPNATNDFITKGQGTIAVPPNHPFALDANGVQITPPNTPTASEVGLPVGAFNPFNPFQQIISGGTRARLADFGNRLFDNENEAWLTTLGVKGDKLFDGSWGYDAAFRYSQILNISRTQDVNVVRFNQIMNANDAIFDPNSSVFIGTTIPYNPFGQPLQHPIAANAATIDYATMFRRDLNQSKLASLDGNVYTTDLFDLPAGGVGLAFGGGWRRESLFLSPDDQGRLKQEAGVGQSFRTQAGRKDWDFYTEVLVPIFSPSMGIPVFHSLEITGADRVEVFRNNDTNALVPKVGVRWQPFDEQLTIRSTWGEGFLEPSLFQFFGGPAFVLESTHLPGGAPQPETQTEVDPNPNLKPEDSREWTGGIVYTPKWITNFIPNSTLTLSVDLWDIERTGVVIVPGDQEVVGRFLSGTLNPGEQVDVDESSQTVTFVRNTYQNAGRENARGADFGLQLQIQTGFGTFTSITQATYLDSFIFQPSALSRAREVSGRTNTDPFEGAFFGAVTGGDAWVKWKGTSRVDWSDWPWKGIGLTWTVHYFDGFHEKFDSAANVAAFGDRQEHWDHGTWFQDAQLYYELIFTPPVEAAPVAGYSKGGKEVIRSKEGKAVESAAAYAMPCWQTIFNNSRITVGVNDIFGTDPPKLFGFENGNSTGYPGYQYDNLGRFIYVELKKKF